MPIYEVTVTRTASVTDTVLVQAEDFDHAVNVACDQADGWDFDLYETSGDVVNELSADEVLERANEVIA